MGWNWGRAEGVEVRPVGRRFCLARGATLLATCEIGHFAQNASLRLSIEDESPTVSFGVRLTRNAEIAVK